jgi:teichuronic acid biosynthesis glycosyltransferase TuaC
MINSICFICDRYPTTVTPASQIFVQNLVWGMADQGVECSVISPLPININYRYTFYPRSAEQRTPSGNIVKVYYPRYFSFGQRYLPGFNSVRLTTAIFHNVAERQFRKLEKKPDVIYGHFLAPAGIVAARIGRKYGIPAFAAYGESGPWSVERFGQAAITRELDSLSGIVAVSSKNKGELTELAVKSEDKIAVFPNAVDSDRFYPRDKAEARKKYGFPQEAFIIAFVGHFDERKGVLRVAEALKGLEDVHVIYAGQGDQDPRNSNTLHCGLVKPEEMPVFLSAADAFLLPTLKEGCCNAVVEAMACGLPVISSNRPFNFDILTEDSASLIDPENISEIRAAVIRLRDDYQLRQKNSLASLERASSLNQKNRAANIWNWIKMMADNGKSRKGDKLFESNSAR